MGRKFPEKKNDAIARLKKSGNVVELFKKRLVTLSDIYKKSPGRLSKIPEFSAYDPPFFENHQPIIGTFPEKYGRAGTNYPDFGTRIIKRGADAPIPPRARSAAAPEGAPPRRIRD